MKHLAVFTLVLLSLSSCIDPDPLPPDPDPVPSPGGTGLMGSYFDASGTRVLARVDPVLDFEWGYGSPHPDVPVDRFSVVWTGEIEFPVAGEYTLFVNSDDGFRLFVDGSDDLFDGSGWIVQGMGVEHVVTRQFSSGRTPVRIEYFEDEWNAGFRLSWEGPGVLRQVVPTMHLYPADAAQSPPEGLPYDAAPPQPPQENGDESVTEPPIERLQSIAYSPMDHTVFIRNPERGWYGHGELMDDPIGFRNFYYSGNRYDSRGLTLSFGSIRIDAYRDNDTLPDHVIDKINRSFEEARDAGVKLIVRVMYNGNRNNIYPYASAQDGDAPLDRVLGHIEQLGPVFQENYDVIAVLQAGLIGEWGEWHGSTNNLHADTEEGVRARRAIINALFDHMLHEDRMLQLRYPRANIEYATANRLSDVDPNTFTTHAPPDDYLFDGDNRVHRIGMYNDCLLTHTHSVDQTEYITDVGTYEWETNVMRPLFDLTASFSRFTPMGGETCHVRWPTPRADCYIPNPSYPYYGAVHELDLLGYDYLNLDFHRPHHERWQSQGCYDEITNRFGYRFALLEGNFSRDVDRGDDLYVSLTIHNDGFGKLYNPRPLDLVLRHADGHERRFVLARDARLVMPLSGDTRTITRGVRIPGDIPVGEYRLYLALPDDSPRLSETATRIDRYSIRLANHDMWTETGWDGLNDLGVIVRIA